VARFFSAATRLYRAEPWVCLEPGDLLVMESESAEIGGAVALVGGQTPDEFGLLLFESAEACARFLERSATLGEPWGALGVALCLVHFERGAALPPSLRRKIARNRWEVAHAAAYPCLECLDDTGAPCSVDEARLARITTCTESVARLVEQRRDDLAAGTPVSEVVTFDDAPVRARVRVSVGLRPAGS